jgi:hypothetical protein
MENTLELYDYEIKGRIQAGSVDHANWILFWAIRNSEHDEMVLTIDASVEKVGEQNG